MENEQQTIDQKKCDCGSCWKCRGFFGSKLNTALLLVLIILMVIAIRIMIENKEIYLPIINREQTEFSQKEKMTWVNSPSDFGTIVSYPSEWQITPQYYSSPAQQAEGKNYLVGYTFSLPTGGTIVWGGAQGGCASTEFAVFKYGISTLACVKGYRAQAGPSAGTESWGGDVSANDQKLFAEFVVKNQ
jgi:hypothetical protein